MLRGPLRAIRRSCCILRRHNWTVCLPPAYPRGNSSGASIVNRNVVLPEWRSRLAYVNHPTDEQASVANHTYGYGYQCIACKRRSSASRTQMSYSAARELARYRSEALKDGYDRRFRPESAEMLGQASASRLTGNDPLSHRGEYCGCGELRIVPSPAKTTCVAPSEWDLQSHMVKQSRWTNPAVRIRHAPQNATLGDMPQDPQATTEPKIRRTHSVFLNDDDMSRYAPSGMPCLCIRTVWRWGAQGVTDICHFDTSVQGNCYYY
jgi:hypothetical protein